MRGVVALKNFKDDCPLCHLVQRKTDAEILFESKNTVIVVCQRCGVPMVVWKSHVTDADPFMGFEMREQLSAFQKREKPVWDHLRILDMKQRSVPDHLHWHLRGVQTGGF